MFADDGCLFVSQFLGGGPLPFYVNFHPAVVCSHTNNKQQTINKQGGFQGFTKTNKPNERIISLTLQYYADITIYVRPLELYKPTYYYTTLYTLQYKYHEELFWEEITTVLGRDRWQGGTPNSWLFTTEWNSLQGTTQYVSQ